MMSALFLLSLLALFAIWFGKRRVALSLSLITISLGLCWLRYHATDPLKLNF